MRPAHLPLRQRTLAPCAAAKRKLPPTYHEIVSRVSFVPIAVHRPECAHSLAPGLLPAALPGLGDRQLSSSEWKLRPTNRWSGHHQVRRHNLVRQASPLAQNADFAIRHGTLVPQTVVEFHSWKELEHISHTKRECQRRELADAPFRAAVEALYCGMLWLTDSSQNYSIGRFDPIHCCSAQRAPGINLHSAIQILADCSRD